MNKSNFLIIMIFNILMIMTLMMINKTNLHPITYMLILIIYTIIISLKMNFMYKSLISYSMFLIMIGGLMVIYMYIISLTNNNFFYLNKKMILLNIMKITPMIILFIYMLNNFKFNLYNYNFEELDNMIYFYKENFYNLNNIYQKINNLSSYFFMLYLYFTLICIMNMCLQFKSPLRKLTSYE